MSASQEQILRGRILTFSAAPQNGDDSDSYTYIEDGALWVGAGVIKACGEYKDVATAARDIPIVDHRPHLLMAGFIDTHIHFPQLQVIGSWGAKLLDWLNTYTFPAETRFADEVHCNEMATAFYDQMINHGTTTAAAYCSVHSASVDAYFSEAERRNMRMVGGKVMMDRNAPDTLQDTPQSGYDDSKTLIGKWHGRGRAHYAITPRFAITSSPEQLETAGALVAEHTDCYVQTHLSENHQEVSFTAELYPRARDYLDVYESYGLLGTKTLLGHCIHLKPREIQAIAETSSVAVFCPTSNLFLGSGLFDYEGLRSNDVTLSIATDVGGGTSYSMLQTLSEGYKILQLQSQNLHTLQAFDLITRGNAAALGLADKIGTLDVGTEADIVVLNASATSAMALRMQTASSLSEELFILQTMGDDRAIDAVYIAGVRMDDANLGGISDKRIHRKGSSRR